MRKSSSPFLAVLPLVFALGAVAGCSSSDASSDEDVGASAGEDALTSDEKAIGASWDGVDEDDLSTDEEAALASTADPLGDDNVQTAATPFALGEGAIHPLSTCTRTTGFNHGAQMSICTTVIDGKAVEQSTADAFMKMHDAAKRAGVSIVVVSGFRTMAKQRELYAAYKAHRGNLAAPPGYSNHQSGHALDLNTKAPGVKSWLIAHAASFGFRRTVPSEDWHYEKW